MFPRLSSNKNKKIRSRDLFEFSEIFYQNKKNLLKTNNNLFFCINKKKKKDLKLKRYEYSFKKIPLISFLFLDEKKIKKDKNIFFEMNALLRFVQIHRLND